MGDVAPIAVLHRNHEGGARLISPGPRRSDVFNPQLLIAADEAQSGVAGQRPGQQTGLAQHLESVANPEHGQAITRRFDDRCDHR
ncbi:MAG: hypothetical protein JWN96_1641 [Mycobacterium sp.]|nr:hypothetical protein [Mycobacterium sp.]